MARISIQMDHDSTVEARVKAFPASGATGAFWVLDISTRNDAGYLVDEVSVFLHSRDSITALIDALKAVEEQTNA